MIYSNDYKNIIDHINYDYVFTSPPDFEELGTDPSKPEIYQDFLVQIFGKMKPTKNLITVSFTDRKFKGNIISKSGLLVSAMYSLGYDLKTHKIWGKSLKENMFRLNYSNILTFGRGKVKQNQDKSFAPDVWLHDNEKYKKYAFGMAIDIPIKCILNYTNEGDIVYDPFMGSGTTAAAAIRTNRKYVGSEINEDYYQLSQERIHEETMKKMLTC
tara:strand:+ start:781 stop:1422 length:642 start_codon:yes stop_codon:yes gene_type:complete